MGKTIIALMALLFVAALGTPLFNGGTPVYAHRGHVACTGGATAIFDLGPGLGRVFGEDTAEIATSGPNALSGDVAFLHTFVLCEPGP